MDTENSFWRLTPFIDVMGSYGAGEYRFEWEREWRVPGGLRFPPDQVAFLFIPDSLHDQVRSFNPIGLSLTRLLDVTGQIIRFAW
jgi:hypothetical protein